MKTSTIKLFTKICIIAILIAAGCKFYQVKKDTGYAIGDTSDIMPTEGFQEDAGYIDIPGLAERLKTQETRLYYMIVSEVKDGRVKIARDDGQSWWINDLGFKPFERVLVEIREYETYEYDDDTIENVWRFRETIPDPHIFYLGFTFELST